MDGGPEEPNGTIRAVDDRLYRTLARVVYLAAGVFVAVWLLDALSAVLLFFLAALVLALALNPAVTWLEDRGVKRVFGTLLVGAAGAAVLGLLGWLVVPPLLQEASRLFREMPDYAAALARRADRMVADYPEVERQLREWRGDAGTLVARALPAAQGLLVRIGRYSLSLVTLVVLGLFLLSTVLYTLIRPRPLLEGYLRLLPPHLRGAGARAFARGSQAVGGYVWANVIVGAVEAVAVAVVLSLLGVPGALVWAALAFFAELVPKLGPYLMAFPPILVALAVDPMTALWVAVFYVVLNQLAGDLLAPVVRSKAMDLHPVSLLFATLAMASLFGLLGAFIATPIAGILKAFYEEFHLARQPEDTRLGQQVEAMLRRDAGDGPPPGAALKVPEGG